MTKKRIQSPLVDDILNGRDTSFIIRNDYRTQILLKNCEFGYYHPSNPLEIPYDIVFEDCTFNQPFSLFGLSKSNIYFNNCYHNEFLFFRITCQELKFGQCYGAYTEFIEGCDIQRVVYNSKETSSIVVRGGNFSSFEIEGNYNSIWLHGGKFNYNFLIKNTVVKSSIFFENGNFSNLTIEESGFNNFYIKGGVFNKGVRINKGVFENDFHITNGEFKEDFKIDDGVFKNNIKFEGGRFEKNISIFKGEIRYLKFENIEKLNRFLTYKDVFIDTFSFSATKGNYNLFINETVFNKVEFWKANSLKDNFFQFNQTRIHELSFDRFSNLGNIYFIDIKPEELFTLNEGIKTKGISLNGPKLVFENSDLGKTTFIDCDLTGFKLEFQSSKISEVFLAGTEMPHSKNIKSKNKAQKRLVLSQIKKIYENRGDSLTANEYYAEEMKTYLSQLTKNFRLTKLPEIINLFFNRISNNFGQSWFLALITALIVIFLSIELFTYSLNFPITYNIVSALEWKIGLMFEYINPTTKIKDFAETLGVRYGSISSLSKFIFGFSRFVLIPFFIYQLIAAFRKHGKKS